ncbi:MAG: hypothetical protein FWG91_03385 [Lachnospiraceae bacterium]|nr:hypothetical protein [Lachnospiraceae bacterium]
MRRYKKFLALALALMLIASTSLVGFANSCDPRCNDHVRPTPTSQTEYRPYSCGFCSNQTESRVRRVTRDICYSNGVAVKTVTVYGDWSVWRHGCPAK